MPSAKKTKIVATLGPATSTKSVLRDMILAGVNVYFVQIFFIREFFLNLSHKCLI